MKLLGLLFVTLSLSTVPAAAGTTANINGYVRDNASRRPIANARLTFVSPAATYEANSDASGFYRLVGVAPARYRVTAIAYNAFHGDWELPRPLFVSVAADQSRRANFLLQWHSELEGFKRYRIIPQFDPFYAVSDGPDIRFVPGIARAQVMPPIQ